MLLIFLFGFRVGGCILFVNGCLFGFGFAS